MLKTLAIFGSTWVALVPRAAFACGACARPNNDVTWIGLGGMMLLPFLVAGVTWVILPKDEGPTP